MGKKIILLRTVLADFQLRFLNNNLPDNYTLINGSLNRHLDLEEKKNVRILIVYELTAYEVDSFPKLEFVQIYGRGVDRVCTKYLEKKGIYYKNNSGEEVANSIAEYVLLQVLLWERNMLTIQNYGIRGEWTWEWRSNFYYKRLTDINVGIVGNGVIGENVGRFLSKNGINVFYINIGTRAKEDDYDKINRSDYISLHLSLDSQTRKIVGKEFIQLMNKDAVLINTSRGEIIDEPILFKALANKSIRGASIDVTEKEPLDNQLCSKLNDKLIITPHISGRTKNVLIGYIEEFIDNVKKEVWK